MKLKQLSIFAACIFSLAEAFTAPVFAGETLAVPPQYEAMAVINDFEKDAEFVTFLEMGFENTWVNPVYVMESAVDLNKRWVEIRNENGETLLVIDKKMSCLLDDRLVVLKSYYETDIKPIIEENLK